MVAGRGGRGSKMAKKIKNRKMAKKIFLKFKKKIGGDFFNKNRGIIINWH